MQFIFFILIYLLVMYNANNMIIQTKRENLLDLYGLCQDYFWYLSLEERQASVYMIKCEIVFL